jgi:hypothetical protein
MLLVGRLAADVYTTNVQPAVATLMAPSAPAYSPPPAAPPPSPAAPSAPEAPEAIDR